MHRDIFIMRQSRIFPFADAMMFGFGILKLSSRDFWAMTPREIRAAASAFHKNAKGRDFTREHLTKLMRDFPDTKTDQSDASSIS